jgi:hypothetical protein
MSITQGLPQDDILRRLPDVALFWRLSIVREIVLSGFQLELYLGEEKTFAYWYAVQIIDEHLKCLDNMMSSVVDGLYHLHFIYGLSHTLVMFFAGSEIQQELRFQTNFLTILQSLCISLFMVRIPNYALSCGTGN